jgi:SAM-dependent methyltransferase
MNPPWAKMATTVLWVQKRGVMADDLEKFFSGNALYGDDFSEHEIAEWFKDEREGYYDIVPDRQPGKYEYFALNWHHGFRFLPKTAFQHILGIGSAYGEELQPVLSPTSQVTILEPSDGFVHPSFEYVKPDPSGKMPFDDGVFDLVTCFGVLHHIPNVTRVVNEIARCLRPGGYFLLREPIDSMGDWRIPRQGLTKRERGIPAKILLNIVVTAGLEILRERRCMYSLTARLHKFLPRDHFVYNSSRIVAVDDWVSNLPIWPKQYYAENVLQKFRPWSVFMVTRKGHAQS